MKIGILSDIHSNYEAFQACLKAFSQEQVNQFIFCGDIVGYGPDPDLCVKKLMSLPLLACVMGNHDAALLMPKLEELFNEEARKALAINKKQLSQESIHFIMGLPSIYFSANYTVVHGTPREPITEYFCNTIQFKNTLSLWKGNICFVGHTHIPFSISGSERSCSLKMNRQDEMFIKINPQKKYVINPGAVGKPRDNNTKLSAAVWDTEQKTIRFLRVKYNFKITQQKMENLGFPSFLIDSLTLGL